MLVHDDAYTSEKLKFRKVLPNVGCQLVAYFLLSYKPSCVTKSKAKIGNDIKSSRVYQDKVNKSPSSLLDNRPSWVRESLSQDSLDLMYFCVITIYQISADLVMSSHYLWLDSSLWVRAMALAFSFSEGAMRMASCLLCFMWVDEEPLWVNVWTWVQISCQV